VQFKHKKVTTCRSLKRTRTTSAVAWNVRNWCSALWVWAEDCSTVAVQLPWSFCRRSVTVSVARHTRWRPMTWDVDVPPPWRVDSRPTDTHALHKLH